MKVIYIDKVSNILPLYDFIYNNNLSLSENYIKILKELNIFDKVSLKPCHITSITKRRIYKVIDASWQKSSLTEFLRKATLIIDIFSFAPSSQ